jgi:hypothetical protein
MYDIDDKININIIYLNKIFINDVSILISTYLNHVPFFKINNNFKHISKQLQYTLINNLKYNVIKNSKYFNLSIINIFIYSFVNVPIHITTTFKNYLPIDDDILHICKKLASIEYLYLIKTKKNIHLFIQLIIKYLQIVLKIKITYKLL